YFISSCLAPRGQITSDPGSQRTDFMWEKMNFFFPGLENICLSGLFKALSLFVLPKYPIIMYDEERN
ncbi:MAG TPA: hypothetical protein VEV44_17565, partial [Pseudoneobacillus sp.]|nr:hypothetical protein [Pseudoneobacillus sp.]